MGTIQGLQCTQERAYTPPRLMSRDSYSISVFEGADNYEMGAIVRKNAIKISKRTVDVLTVEAGDAVL